MATLPRKLSSYDTIQSGSIPSENLKIPILDLNQSQESNRLKLIDKNDLIPSGNEGQVLGYDANGVPIAVDVQGGMTENEKINAFNTNLAVNQLLFTQSLNEIDFKGGVYSLLKPSDIPSPNGVEYSFNGIDTTDGDSVTFNSSSSSHFRYVDNGNRVIIPMSNGQVWLYDTLTPYGQVDTNTSTNTSSISEFLNYRAPNDALMSDDGLTLVVIGGGNMAFYTLSTAWNLSAITLQGNTYYQVVNANQVTKFCTIDGALKGREFWVLNGDYLYKVVFSTAWTYEVSPSKESVYILSYDWKPSLFNTWKGIQILGDRLYLFGYDGEGGNGTCTSIIEIGFYDNNGNPSGLFGNRIAYYSCKFSESNAQDGGAIIQNGFIITKGSGNDHNAIHLTVTSNFNDIGIAYDEANTRLSLGISDSVGGILVDSYSQNMFSYDRPISNEGDREAIFISGNYFFTITSGGMIYRYDMSDPNDPTTIDFSSVLSGNINKTFAGLTNYGAKYFFVSPDGTRIYITYDLYNGSAYVNSTVQWNLSTAFDVANMTDSGHSLSVGGRYGAFFISDDGTTLWNKALTNTDYYIYTLGTPWELNTNSYVSAGTHNDGGLWIKTRGGIISGAYSGSSLNFRPVSDLTDGATVGSVVSNIATSLNSYWQGTNGNNCCTTPNGGYLLTEYSGKIHQFKISDYAYFTEGTYEYQQSIDLSGDLLESPNEVVVVASTNIPSGTSITMKISDGSNEVVIPNTSFDSIVDCSALTSTSLTATIVLATTNTAITPSLDSFALYFNE